MLLRPYNSHKLQPHTKPCLFLGYPTHSKGYICLDLTTHRIYITRHVLFNEFEFLSHENSSFSSGSWHLHLILHIHLQSHPLRLVLSLLQILHGFFLTFISLRFHLLHLLLHLSLLETLHLSLILSFLHLSLTLPYI